MPSESLSTMPTSGTVGTDSILGRGNRDSNRMFREWYNDVAAAAERGDRAAYVFVMGSVPELLRAFDVQLVFPEINGLQSAVRHAADDDIARAEDYGFSTDVCAYVKADIGRQLENRDHEMGRIPPPALVVHSTACNTYIKWAEILARLHRAPIFTFDIPEPRLARRAPASGRTDFQNDLAYVRGQLYELIALLEELTGRRLDMDELRELMGHANRMARGFFQVLELNRSMPAVYNALTDGTIYLGIVNAFMARPEGAKYFEDLVEELTYKAEAGIGTKADEKYRLIFWGLPCYPIFRRFSEMFTEHGGALVASGYMWAPSGGLNHPFEYDLDRPIDSLAEGLLVRLQGTMEDLFRSDRSLRNLVEDYAADGVVYHAVKSCRTISTGLTDSRRALMEKMDVATLFIESDHMDRRVVSEAQLKNRIDAFFEGLATRKARQALSTKG